MRWTVHGERSLYESEWVRLVLVDVEIPGGERFEHHVVRMPNHAAGTVVRDPDRGVLLLWRHRFITDTWGWEIPAGRIDPGETPAAGRGARGARGDGLGAGARCGRSCTSSRRTGISDQVFHIFVADGATHVGDPTDAGESERIEWVQRRRSAPARAGRRRCSTACR